MFQLACEIIGFTVESAFVLVDGGGAPRVGAAGARVGAAGAGAAGAGAAGVGAAGRLERVLLEQERLEHVLLEQERELGQRKEGLQL